MLVVKFPTPLVLSTTVASGMDPSRKATVPVGTPVFEATEARKVTFCPVEMVVADDVNRVVVALRPCEMVTKTGDEAEPASLESPP